MRIPRRRRHGGLSPCTIDRIARIDGTTWDRVPLPSLARVQIYLYGPQIGFSISKNVTPLDFPGRFR